MIHLPECKIAKPFCWNPVDTSGLSLDSVLAISVGLALFWDRLHKIRVVHKKDPARRPSILGVWHARCWREWCTAHSAEAEATSRALLNSDLFSVGGGYFAMMRNNARHEFSMHATRAPRESARLLDVRG